jgi:hypothetical protein
MATVQIQQSFSSSRHPALLSESDIDVLGLLENAPAGTHLAKPFLPSVSSDGGSLDRRDAGVLIIMITFVLGGVAGGVLQEAGKDIYAWAKNRLIKLMNQKQEAVRASTSAYPFKMPEWQIEISVDYGNHVGFTASIKATSAESMEEAIERLTKCLDENASAMVDLSNERYYWRCSETVAGLYVRSNIHES